MAILKGLDASYHNKRNGMVKNDMRAAVQVAAQLGEVIVFRSTGPWAKRWIKRGHPTKNFHIKGKSSDWGPQAGLVPYDAMYSKRPDRSSSEADRTKACRKSVDEGWARAVPLVLDRSALQMQIDLAEGGETGIRRTLLLPNKEDLLLYAGPQGSSEEYVFLASWRSGVYHIETFKDIEQARRLNAFKLADGSQRFDTTPLLVMASNEMGADDKPITGDYDLFVVIPTWASYGSQAPAAISKPGIALQGHHRVQPQGLHFEAGVGMDNVLDPSLHTFGSPRPIGARTAQTSARFAAAVAATPRSEHADMGNLTPRVLRCINALNLAMGATGAKGVGRRVHHNAENYRNAMFGALTASDMQDTSKGGGGYGDGFPLTAFLPPHARLEAEFGTCCTIESYLDLQRFGTALHQAGFFVPKNAAWGLLKAFDTPE